MMSCEKQFVCEPLEVHSIICLVGKHDPDSQKEKNEGGTGENTLGGVIFGVDVRLMEGTVVFFV